jgi:hypothetical protein
LGIWKRDHGLSMSMTIKIDEGIMVRDTCASLYYIRERPDSAVQTHAWCNNMFLVYKVGVDVPRHSNRHLIIMGKQGVEKIMQDSSRHVVDNLLGMLPSM